MAAARALTRVPRRTSLWTRDNRILVSTVLIAWAGWEVLAFSGIYIKEVFPSSVRVIWALATLLAQGWFYEHVYTTLYEIVVAFGIGSLIGISVGIVLGVFGFAGRAIEPYLSGLMATPKIVFFPIAIMAAGTGVESKIVLGAWGAIFPTVLNTYAGMLAVKPIHVQVARIFGLSPIGIVTKVYLPSLLRPILVGLKLGLGVCITGVLLAEIKNSKAGLGYLVNENYTFFRIDQMYAVIILIFVVVVLLNLAINKGIDFMSKGGQERAVASHAGI